MGKRALWLRYGLLTGANIAVLVLSYFALVSTPTTIITVIPTQAFEVSTPTPIPLVGVVQALQNLPRGYRFPNTLPELMNIAGIALLPEATVPFNAITEYEGGLERLLGKVARADIYREQPILSTLLVDNLTQLSHVGSDLAAMVPSDRVAATVSLKREMLPIGLAIGDHVKVFYTDVRNDLQNTRPVTDVLVLDALVLWIGEVPPDGHLFIYPTPNPYYYDGSYLSNVTPTPTIAPSEVLPIVLVVTNQDAAELIWAEHSHVPIALVMLSALDDSGIVVTPTVQDSLNK